MRLLSDGQHGPILAAHQRQLGYPLERLWNTMGVCRVQYRGCGVSLLALPRSEE